MAFKTITINATGKGSWSTISFRISGPVVQPVSDRKVACRFNGPIGWAPWWVCRPSDRPQALQGGLTIRSAPGQAHDRLWRKNPLSLSFLHFLHENLGWIEWSVILAD